MSKKVLCVDELSGRSFKISIDEIHNAVLEINQLLMSEGTASLNDFYESLGESPILLGRDVGWASTAVTVRFDSTLLSNYKSAVLIRLAPTPNVGFNA